MHERIPAARSDDFSASGESSVLPRPNTGPGLGVAFLLYAIAAATLLYSPGLLSGDSYLGMGTDPSLYIWMFRFLPKAIVHLHNPLVLEPAWAPGGLNIMQATTTPALALLAWPITALAGPVVAFNVVSMAAPALGATSAFLFASAFTRRWGAAFVAGWIFGFSTYVFAALIDHLQVDFIAFIPLAFLAVTQRSRGRIGFLQYVAWLAAVLIAEFLTSLETFVTMGLFLALYTAVSEVSRSSRITQIFRLTADNLVVGLVAGASVTALVVSPFILTYFSDYSQIPHLLRNGGNWSLDLLDIVVPTPVTWLGGKIALPITRHFTGNWSEDLGYIGFILLAIVLSAAWAVRRERIAWPLIALFFIAIVSTLGPNLHILGHVMFRFPWAFVGQIPLLRNAEPGRLAVFFLLAVVGLTALWIDRFSNETRIATLLLAVAAILTLPAAISHTRGWWNSRIPAAKLFSSGEYRRLIPAGSTVLFLPFGFSNENAMFWQTETNGYFRMVNGYGNFIPPEIAVWPASKMLASDRPTSEFVQQFDQFAKADKIARVIVPQRELAVWAAPLRRAGWQGTTVGRMTVFSWPSAARAATETASPSTARARFDGTQLAALRHAAACMLDRHAVRIDPEAAVTAHCLKPAYGPRSGQKRSNWNRVGGWLGRFGPYVAIGLNTIGPVAEQLARNAGPDTVKIYYPYPKRYDPAHKPAERGEFLEVLNEKALSH